MKFSPRMEFKHLVYHFYSFDADYISFNSERVFQNSAIFEVIKQQQQNNKPKTQGLSFLGLLFPDFLLPNPSSYTVFLIAL